MHNISRGCVSGYVVLDLVGKWYRFWGCVSFLVELRAGQSHEGSRHRSELKLVTQCFWWCLRADARFAGRGLRSWVRILSAWFLFSSARFGMSRRYYFCQTFLRFSYSGIPSFFYLPIRVFVVSSPRAESNFPHRLLWLHWLHFCVMSYLYADIPQEIVEEVVSFISENTTVIQASVLLGK